MPHVDLVDHLNEAVVADSEFRKSLAQRWKRLRSLADLWSRFSKPTILASSLSASPLHIATAEGLVFSPISPATPARSMATVS